jgi:hypothetical protein
MKLKLDLHSLFDDGKRIETALQDIIGQAVTKRASEVEIIPGKGSGALKKSVLRFLDRPEIKAKYHRIEKDGDNWGRLFVHFRWERLMEPKAVVKPPEMTDATCFCCQGAIPVAVDRLEIEEQGKQQMLVDCPFCGSPNQVTLSINRRGLRVDVVSGYEAEP